MIKLINYYSLLTILLFSCGENNQKFSSSNNPMDDAQKFARGLYGENVNLVLKGDVNANGKPDALALVINKQINDMKFWILKGGVIENDKDEWKVILNMREKVYSTKGPLINKEEAKYGYIFSFDMAQNPIKFSISLANAQGLSSSDEVLIKWSASNEIYELSTGDSDKKIP